MPVTRTEIETKRPPEGGSLLVLIGLEMIDRGIGRDGYKVFSSAGEQIGEITSGSPGPFIKKNIALAYVPVEYAVPDTEFAVEIRGAMVKARRRMRGERKAAIPDWSDA